MKKLAVFTILLLSSGLCIIAADPGNGNAYGKDHGSGNPHGVPEISAGAAISGLALLSGTLLKIRRRGNRQ